MTISPSVNDTFSYPHSIIVITQSQDTEKNKRKHIHMRGRPQQSLFLYQTSD
jgi:hypothetical protein